MRVLPPIALALLAFSAPGRAQDATGDAPDRDVVVTGVREAPLDLDRLQRARDVFRAKRPAFAPDSTLLFLLRVRNGAALDGTRLLLRADGRSVAVPVGNDGRFTLPDLPAGRWTLVHNRRADQVRVRALVLSPGTDEAHRTLGDLRLQCRVGWQLSRGDYPFYVRAGFDALGGCDSQRFAIYEAVSRPVAAARVSEGTRGADLPLYPDRRSYRVPLRDRGLSNAARVVLTYR